MTWDAKTSCGNESAKIRWELIPYVHGTGLDLGCGPWKALPHMIGIDAKDYRNVGLVMDATRLRPWIGEGSMDFVYSSHFLEHVENPAMVLAEWWSVLKVGGRLVLYLPHKDHYPRMGEPGANPDHKSDFDAEDILALMREPAFMQEKCWTLLRNEVRAEDDEYSFFMVFMKEAQGHGQSVELDEVSAQKRCAVVRPGAYGDALVGAQILPALKEQGYHVTVYTEEGGLAMLRHDPHADRIVAFNRRMLPAPMWPGYFAHEKKKFERWINLVGTMEDTFLASAKKTIFFMPKGARHLACNVNYSEMVHAAAELPFRAGQQKFYPSLEELVWANRERACIEGPVLMLCPSGSTLPKFWPHYDRFAHMAANAGFHVIVAGDLRKEAFDADLAHPRILVWAMDRPIREVMSFAQVCDVVVGEETGVLNAVASEPMLKVVLLSHSSHENLTKHWVNTASLAANVPCQPCHRLIGEWDHCAQEEETMAAACQATIKPEKVLEVVMAHCKELL